MATSSMWERMTPAQRISAVNIDIMNHPDFATLSGIVMMGNVKFIDGMPTAGTDGLDVMYGTEFMLGLTRKQLRFVQLHESLHKALRHCVDYKDIVAKYPQLSNVAMDYVVNAFIEQTDPSHAFIDFTTDPEPLLDTKYYDRSFVDVLQDLLKQQPPKPKKQSKPQDGDGGGQGDAGDAGDEDGDGYTGPQPLDEHVQSKQMTEAEADKLTQDIEDALNHGDMVSKRIKAGKSGGGSPISGLGVKRDTDWRNALREWFEEICAGDEYSRFCPPNKKFLPLGVLMPTHFDVSAGEIALFCDTSGSMSPVYPVLFGEIANIAQQANPERIRIIWWDTKVRGEQLFERNQFADIAKQFKPAGGGGTTPQCVADYLHDKKYPLTGAIWLTDGYLDGMPVQVCSNELWGVFNNSWFKPAHGKVVRVNS